jgi:hypothetical protein
MLRPIRLHCVGVRISTGLLCVHILVRSKLHEYTIRTCTKFDWHWAHVTSVLRTSSLRAVPLEPTCSLLHTIALLGTFRQFSLCYYLNTERPSFTPLHIRQVTRHFWLRSSSVRTVTRTRAGRTNKRGLILTRGEGFSVSPKGSGKIVEFYPTSYLIEAAALSSG